MKRFINILLVALCVAALSFLTYRYGRNSAESDIADLRNQIAKYQEEETNAVVVKRVSQQMEDIAYQQKAISDLQRERAEQQSLLAMANAQKAEKESESARKAEAKAVDALKDAEVQRNLAVGARKDAENQLVQTLLQKSITDTLSYRTLGRTLASASISQHEAKNYAVSNTLAYASNYFISKYNGNVYQNESFQALVRASGESRRFNTQKHAAVGGTVKIDGSGDGCIVVTKFGGIEKWQHVSGNAVHTDLYHNKVYDFRDVELEDDGSIWALSREGTLCCLPKSGKDVMAYPLSPDNYFNIIKLSAATYMIVAQKSICWFDTKSRKVTSSVKLPGVLSTVTLREKTLLLFYNDGKYAEMDLGGKITPKASPVQGVVTAAFYDKKRGCCFYGMKTGKVLEPKTKRVLSDHASSITDIDLDGDILITSAYDKEVHIWNLAKLYDGSTTSEWLTPVVFKLDGWPLNISLDRNKDYVWVGTSNGNLFRQSYSVRNMVSLVHGRLHRDLTQNEWKTYVGTSVPYVKFK